MNFIQVCRKLNHKRLFFAAALGCSAGSVAAADSAVIPAQDVHWSDVRKPDGSKLGLKTSELWSRAEDGAHGSLTIFPAGFKEPLHRHSRTFRVVVIKGTMRFTVAGNETADLLPGSFVSITAEVPHYAHCMPYADCEVLVQQDGPMDVKLGDH